MRAWACTLRRINPPFHSIKFRVDTNFHMQIKNLVSSDALRKACPAPFDEGLLWRSEGSEILAGELQVRVYVCVCVRVCVRVCV